MLQGANENNSVMESTNSSESIRINSEVDEERRRNFKRSPIPNGSKQSGKYLCDEKLREEAKVTLSNYIGKNCIEEIRIRIRDDEAKGYVVRVKIQGDQEIRVSEFLNGSFCKDKRISRFALMTDNEQNGLSCDINARGIRCYKVQNGSPVMMTINWCVGEKKCTIKIELGVSSLKIVNLNRVTEEELDTNKEIRINGKSLAEAVQSARGSLQSTNLESKIFEQISLPKLDMQLSEHSDDKGKSHTEKIKEERERSGKDEKHKS